MSTFDWNSISDFDRFPKLDSIAKVGSETKIKFLNDGNFVSAEQLKEAKAKFPRDSIVLAVEEKGESKELWVASKSFSVMKQLKKIREKHGSLKGIVVKIKRVSDATDATNYEISEA
jgi:hypothetical protein